MSGHPRNSRKGRNNIVEKLRTSTPNQEAALIAQWTAANGKYATNLRNHINKILWNNTTKSMINKNKLKTIINNLTQKAKNEYNSENIPILTKYLGYLNQQAQRIASLTAEKGNAVNRLAASQKEINTLKEQIASGKQQVENLEAAHGRMIENMKAAQKTAANVARGQQLLAFAAIAKATRELKNAKNAQAQATNASAAAIAKLEANMAAAALSAANKNKQIANAQAALAKAANNKAAHNVAMANLKAAHNANKARAAQNKANANAALAAAHKAVANATSEANRAKAEAAERIAEEAARAAAADQKAAEAEAAKNAALAQAQQAEAGSAEATRLMKEAQAQAAAANAAKKNANAARNAAQANANRYASQFANAERQIANKTAALTAAQQNTRRQLWLRAVATGKAVQTEAKLLEAEKKARLAGANAADQKARANAAQANARAKAAETNAAKAAAAAALKAKEAAEKAGANAAAQAALNKQAAEASAAAMAAAQAEQQAAKNALEALKATTVNKSLLNQAQAALAKANANKTALTNKHAANMAALRAEANSATASAANKNAALKALQAAANANKNAAIEKLRKLEANSAANKVALNKQLVEMKTLKNAANKATANQKANYEAKLAAKELATAATIKALEANAASARAQAANIQKQANALGAQGATLQSNKNAAEKKAANLEAELAKAKTLVGAATLTGMAAARVGGAAAGAALGAAGGLARRAGLMRQAAGPNTGRKNVPPTGLGTTPLPARLENNPLIKRIQNTKAAIGNKGHNLTRKYLIERANDLIKAPNSKNAQNAFLKQIVQWSVSSTLKPNNPTLRAEVKNKTLTLSNFNTFVKNYLPKLERGPISLTTNLKPPPSPSPNFSGVTVRWLNNWHRFSNKELTTGINNKNGTPISKNGKVNAATLKGQTQLKLLNLVRNANKNGIRITDPGSANYFIRKYNSGKNNPYAKWLINSIVSRRTTGQALPTLPPPVAPAPAPVPSLKNRIEQYRRRLQNTTTNYNKFKKVRNDPTVPRNVRLNSSIKALISAREAQEQKKTQRPPAKANIRMVKWVSSEKPNPARKSNTSNYSMKHIDGGYYIQVNGKYRPVLNYNSTTKTARISLLNKDIQGTPGAQKGKVNVLGLR
jgi:hypothetical protein